jgi:antitoxin (DNA-binding transcriptional repressor) of toxin-antitoxin stability system
MIVETVKEAETHLYQLLKKALSGEDVVIQIDEEEKVNLIAQRSEKKSIKFGLCEGMGTVPHDFDDEDPEINTMFYGEDI